MEKHSNENDCNDNNIIFGNSKNISIKEQCNSEIRVDVTVFVYDNICIWGQIKDFDNKPIPNICVKLIKVSNTDKGETYKKMAHSLSDLKGFYEFNLCVENTSKDDLYKIIACSNDKISNRNEIPFVSPKIDKNISSMEICNCENCDLIRNCNYYD